MLARGGDVNRGETANEDYSAHFTANEFASTPYGIQNNASESAYSSPGKTGSAKVEDERDDVTQET